MMTVESGAELDVGYTLTNQIHSTEVLFSLVRNVIVVKKRL